MNNKIEYQISLEITQNLKDMSNAIQKISKVVDDTIFNCNSFEDIAIKSHKNAIKEVISVTSSLLSIYNNTMNLKLITFAQSAYTKAVSSTTHALSVYQQGVSTARSAIASTTGATKAMNIAIASSPYLLVAAAVATLGVGIYNLAVNNSEAAKAQKRLDEAMLDMNKEISSKQLSLDTLFNSLYKAEEGSEGFLLCLYCIISFSSVLFALFSLSCFSISSRSSCSSSRTSFLFSSS